MFFLRKEKHRCIDNTSMSRTALVPSFVLFLFNMPSIKLQSSDGEIITTDIQIVKCSGTIRTMLEHCVIEEDEIVPLSNVKSPILKMAINWAEHHKDDPQPTKQNESKEKPTDGITPWDADFIEVEMDTLVQLMAVANYLDINGLFELSCRRVADLVSGKTRDEIRRMCSFENFLPQNSKSDRKSEFS